MEAKTVLVADYANIAENGKPNVMGIFRQIYSDSFPARQPEMFLVAILEAGIAEKGQKRNITIKLLNPDATQELVNYSKLFDVPNSAPGVKPEVNIILRMRDIVFTSPGPYFFSILVDNDQKATHPIELVQTINTTKS